MIRLYTVFVLLLLLTISACKKESARPAEKTEISIDDAKVVIPSLTTMLEFLYQHAQLVRHYQDTAMYWWQLDTVLIDGKAIKHNSVFFPTFHHFSNSCQTSREFNFYQAAICPDQNIIVPVRADVRIIAGSRQFVWRNAAIQWRQNKSTANACPAEDWGHLRLPKTIVVRVKPKSTTM